MVVVVYYFRNSSGFAILFFIPTQSCFTLYYFAQFVTNVCFFFNFLRILFEAFADFILNYLRIVFEYSKRGVSMIDFAFDVLVS